MHKICYFRCIAKYSPGLHNEGDIRRVEDGVGGRVGVAVQPPAAESAQVIEGGLEGGRGGVCLKQESDQVIEGDLEQK